MVTRLRGELLLHHRSAVPMGHDLLVGHAVALADRPLREILVRRLVMRGGAMIGFRMRRRASMARLGVVGSRLASVRRMRVRNSMFAGTVIRVVLPGLSGGIMGKGRRQLRRSLRRRWCEVRRGLLLRRGLAIGHSLLRGERRRDDHRRYRHGNPLERRTKHDFPLPAAFRSEISRRQDSAAQQQGHVRDGPVQPSKRTTHPVRGAARLRIPALAERELIRTAAGVPFWDVLPLTKRIDFDQLLIG